MLRAIEDFFTSLGFKTAWKMVALMPRRQAYALFSSFARSLHRSNGAGVRQLRKNYARLRPELSRAELEKLVGAGLDSYMRYWCEAFRLHTLGPREIDDLVIPCGDIDQVFELVESGRPVVFFLGHFGNWDLAGAWACRHLSRVTTVAERLRPEDLYDAFVSYRRRIGIRIYPQKGEPRLMDLLGEALAEGDLVPLLADRDLSKRRVPVTINGHQASAAAGPAVLAWRHDVALFPVSCLYEGDRKKWRMRLLIHPQVSSDYANEEEAIPAMTQSCVDSLAESMQTHTEDWHMMQAVFSADLDPERL